jgi:hypothetical protein
MLANELFAVGGTDILGKRLTLSLQQIMASLSSF